MRVRDHVVLSTVGAALLYPVLQDDVVGAWAASIMIDADHYAWFCLNERRLSPLAAMHFFGQAHPPQHVWTRLLHHWFVLTLLLALARSRRSVLMVLGMAIHVGLDAHHTARLAAARKTALRRDRYTCQSCGRQGPDIVAHVWRQPFLLPSYRTENLTSLCRTCHEAVHVNGRPPAPAVVTVGASVHPVRQARIA